MFLLLLSTTLVHAAPGGLTDRSAAIETLLASCDRKQGVEAMSCYSDVSISLEAECKRALDHIRTSLGTAQPAKLAAVESDATAWDASRQASNAMWLVVVNEGEGVGVHAERSTRQRAARARELLQLEDFLSEVPKVKSEPLGGAASADK